MELVIENIIDRALENISSELYIFSIGLGIALMIVGLILFFTNKKTKGKKSIANGGLIFFIIGIVAIISGLVQM